MSRAYIGIGSNLGDPRANVLAAIAALTAAGRVLAASSLYRTTPWGVANQPDYVNAAVLLETDLAPRALLDALKILEVRLGRVGAERWAARVIDLDILTYDDRDVAEDGLTIPHRHLRERAFAVVPLAEIDSSFEPLRAALDARALAQVRRLDPAS